MAVVDMEKLVSLCKRRGFIFPSSEIYGGLNGCWDYGPLGVELKRNIKEAWWQDMVSRHDELSQLPNAPAPYAMVGLDCSIIMNPRVWEASGHVGGFSDPMVDCKECRARFRADQLWLVHAEAAGMSCLFRTVQAASSEEAVSGLQSASQLKAARKQLKVADENVTLRAVPYAERTAEQQITCPCDKKMPNVLTEPRQFNLMFRTNVGALEDSSSVAYLRPETAQGIFVNFANVCDTARVRLPFGIAQIGKAFRNEINPRNFTFRSREFEQMEIEFFCHPETAPAWYQYWRDRRFQWYVQLGLRGDNLRLREHASDELAHYAAGCADVEYHFPFGVSELEGIANRTDFDLRQHAEFSKKPLMYFDDQETDKSKQKFYPHVIEPSAGADRAALAFLCEAYTEDEAPDEDGKAQSRVLLKLHPRIAPIKAGIFPLVKKDGMPEKAQDIYRTLRRRMNVFYDDKGAVGRRYRRQDEAGTPFCITVDGTTMQDDTVTVRERDSLKQDRLPIAELAAYLDRAIQG